RTSETDVQACKIESNPEPPADRFPHEGQPSAKRTANSRPMGGRKALRANSGSPRTVPRIRPARRSALSDGHDSSRHRAQQDSQGYGRTADNPARFPRAHRHRLET